MRYGIGIVFAMCMACGTDAEERAETSGLSDAAQNYAWMVGHWKCDSTANFYTTVAPEFGSHHVTADYSFNLVEDAPDHLLVHETYRETSLDPAFPADNYDAFITIDLTQAPGSQGHVARLAVAYENGDSVDATGTLNGRTRFFLGNFTFHGLITTTVDGLTRSWTRVNFAEDHDPKNGVFGDFGDNFRIQIFPGSEKQYLQTACIKDLGHG